MEDLHENSNNCQNVKTEKILPRVIKIEETNCSICRRVRKFYSCRQCREVDGHMSFLTQEIPSSPTGKEKRFPGFISGLAKFQVSELKKKRVTLSEKEKLVIEATETLSQRQKLRADIIETKLRIETLKKMRRIQIEGMKKLEMEKKSVESTVDQLHRRSKRTQLKKSKITDYMNTKKYVVEKVHTSLQKQSKELEIIGKQQIQDLVTHIFPIVGISQDETFDSDKSSDDEHNRENSMNLLEEELAEARRLSFVHGRWIYDQREGPDLVRLSIASSRVNAPADGNYTACEAWLKSMLLSASVTSESTETSTSSSIHRPEPHRSSGASIYAALCHATHLMHTIRKILCLHMPYKLHYRQFSVGNMNVQEFLWNVHKLNGNVLSLCLRNGVQPQLIHPLHTLPNIQNAIQMYLHNGASTSQSILTPELISSLEEALEESSDPLPDDDENRMEDSLSEWENSLSEDWESLIPKQSSLAHQYTSAAPFQSQAQSVDISESQGLVSSAVAWVTKGWWNR
ncbi:beclin 1-associated autophagy-related key regulator-like [Styela clava]